MLSPYCKHPNLACSGDVVCEVVGVVVLLVVRVVVLLDVAVDVAVGVTVDVGVLNRHPVNVPPCKDSIAAFSILTLLLHSS